MTAAAPIVRTERLLLRPFRPGDLDRYAVLRADPENIRFLPGGVAAASAAPARARAVVESWGAAAWAPGPVPWAMEHEGRLVGHLGLRPLPGQCETELLYMLDRARRGRGLATEGALAAIAFARDRLGLSALVALADPANAASIAVMRRCGFAPDGETRLFGMKLVRHRLAL